MYSGILCILIAVGIFSTVTSKFIEGSFSNPENNELSANEHHVDFSEMMDFWSYLAKNDQPRSKTKKSPPLVIKLQPQSNGFQDTLYGLANVRSIKPLVQANMHSLRPFYDFIENSYRLFNKKSTEDSKVLRFHPCYFNPVSCF